MSNILYNFYSFYKMNIFDRLKIVYFSDEDAHSHAYICVYWTFQIYRTRVEIQRPICLQ